jgi:hypothetical protein
MRGVQSNKQLFLNVMIFYFPCSSFFNLRFRCPAPGCATVMKVSAISVGRGRWCTKTALFFVTTKL